MENIYSAEYFIKKFEAIPDSKWTTGDLIKNDEHGVELCCALGHLDVRYDPELKDWRSTEESNALITLLGGDPQSTEYNSKWAIVTIINDIRFEDLTWRDSTPKQRILKALRSKLNPSQL
jgi:hypothetical protein